MSPQRPSIVLHAHCYQPPRADPWLGEIPRERSAAPYHDWNERILHECYGPLGAARVTDEAGRIVALVNTYAYLDFDVGPTLLAWLERAAPDTYAAILEADAASVARLGHGNAIAAPFHHAILPLATRRDKVTEVRWGIDDFRARFGRSPEGMWLPETAVDDETLDVLAEAGIAFTVVAPHQVEGLPPAAAAGRYTTHGGRSIAVIVLDGTASHAVAFGNALHDAASWERDLRKTTRDLTLIATDGETYGHHHIFGEMALAALLHRLTATDAVRVENCAAYLARQLTLPEVSILPNTSWSCPHGVERWRADCGCRMHPERPSQQTWRSVLRTGLEWLADELHAVYARDAAGIFVDPWVARDVLGWVACSGTDLGGQLTELAPNTDAEQRRRAVELLELERNALRMFTSCAWFFDDLAGLEGRQALRAAARAIELTGPDATRIEAGFLDRLRAAVSNDPAAGRGDAVYLAERPPVPMPVLLAGAAALAAAAGLPDDDVLPAGVAIQRDAGDAIAVTGACGGRSHRVRTTVENGTRPAGTVTVIDADTANDPYTLSIKDLPDCARERLVAHWRGVIVERRLSAGAMARLREGTRLETVMLDALHDAVDRLVRKTSAAHVDAVLDLVDLAHLLDTALPYDVLNQLVRLCGSPADRASTLHPVAERLGLD